jgi:hypothetical protein
MAMKLRFILLSIILYPAKGKKKPSFSALDSTKKND